MKRTSPASIAVGLVLCGLVGYVVAGPRLWASWSFTQAKTLFTQELAAENYQAAYDLLLTASRIDSGEPALLDLVQQYVTAARKSGDERALDLADSLLARAESIVPFHAPGEVKNARRRLNALESNRLSPEASDPLPDEATDEDPVVSYLVVAESEEAPLAIRSAAVEQARQMIDSTMLEVAVARSGDAGDLQERYKAILDRMDQAERVCLKGLFNEWCGKRDAWKANVTRLLGADDTPEQDEKPEAINAAVGLVEKGMGLMQEVSPYSKADVAGATEAEAELAKDLQSLQRYRAWYRNQAVLKAVNEVEERWKKDTYEESLTRLAAALQEEELLIPYVAERFNQKWNEAFSGLESKRPKNAPEMLRLRFLGRLLPKGESK